MCIKYWYICLNVSSDQTVVIDTYNFAVKSSYLQPKKTSLAIKACKDLLL